VARQYIRNVSAAVVGSVAMGIAQVLLLGFLARFLSSGYMADFVFALMLVRVSEVISDFGARIEVTRDVARRQQRCRHGVVAPFGQKIFFTGILIGFYVMLPLGGLSPVEKALCGAAGFFETYTDPFLWWWRGRERLDVEAAFRAGGRILVAVALGLGAFLGLGLTALLIIWLTVGVVRWAVEGRRWRRETAEIGTEWFHVEPISLSLAKTWRLIRLSFPAGISLFILSLSQRLGVILIGVSGAKQQLAGFGPIVALVGAGGLIVTAMTAAAFPGMSRAYHAGETAVFEGMVARKTCWIAGIMLMAAVVGVAVGPGMIALYLGRRFGGYAEVMVLAMPAYYYSGVAYWQKYVSNAMRLDWGDTVVLVLGILSFVGIFYAQSGRGAKAAVIAWSASEIIMVGLRAYLIGIRSPRLGRVFLTWWAWGLVVVVASYIVTPWSGHLFAMTANMLHF